MLGDQDVLTSLLASERFSDIPLKVLRRGKDILQCMGLTGFTVFERLRAVFYGLPTFIHSQASKPWIVFSNFREPLPNLKAYISAIYFDLNPYTLAALAYRHELSDGAELHPPPFSPKRILSVVRILVRAFSWAANSCGCRRHSICEVDYVQSTFLSAATE